jgi:putative molybdopterin biosynthesis protein
VGPFDTHLGVALAIRGGRADAGVAVRAAADACGLDFLPLGVETYQLTIPAAFFSQPRLARFLDRLTDGIAAEARAGAPGYGTASLGTVRRVRRPEAADGKEPNR